MDEPLNEQGKEKKNERERESKNRIERDLWPQGKIVQCFGFNRIK